MELKFVTPTIHAISEKKVVKTKKRQRQIPSITSLLGLLSEIDNSSQDNLLALEQPAMTQARRG